VDGAAVVVISAARLVGMEWPTPDSDDVHGTPEDECGAPEDADGAPEDVSPMMLVAPETLSGTARREGESKTRKPPQEDRRKRRGGEGTEAEGRKGKQGRAATPEVQGSSLRFASSLSLVEVLRSKVFDVDFSIWRVCCSSIAQPESDFVGVTRPVGATRPVGMTRPIGAT
jgi:hypothetical protein